MAKQQKPPAKKKKEPVTLTHTLTGDGPARDAALKAWLTECAANPDITVKEPYKYLHSGEVVVEYTDSNFPPDDEEPEVP